ncbi:MAG: acireductone synthase [Parachlamydiales bacterium]|nr:acireductone synthase [Candidatus Acheromyda pituitae]
MWKYLFCFWTLAVCASEPIEVILTDIEGTTTSISFVHDTLFPYAKKHVKDYLFSHSNEPAVVQIVQEVLQSEETDLDQAAQVLLSWMEQDKKITPLKSLQGMMWKEGYEQGAFLSHVYDDAFEQLEQWKRQGLFLYVYSSGSVQAQKLLFGHTPFGDMTPLFSGHFDTCIGGKKESLSYVRIAEQLAIAPEKILFLSDSIEELDAAKQAGMQTFLIARDGMQTPDNCPHFSAASFSQVTFEQSDRR